MSRRTRETLQGVSLIFAYGAITLFGEAFQSSSANQPTHPASHCGLARTLPRPLCCNGAILSHNTGLGSSPFARRYSGNRFFFLFLRVLRCFSSPGSPSEAMNSLQSNSYGKPPLLGFPIRISPVQSLFGSSPELFAAYHVLHRLLAPRHPP